MSKRTSSHLSNVRREITTPDGLITVPPGSEPCRGKPLLVARWLVFQAVHNPVLGLFPHARSDGVAYVGEW